jgi:hypothetical protein
MAFDGTTAETIGRTRTMILFLNGLRLARSVRSPAVHSAREIISYNPVVWSGVTGTISGSEVSCSTVRTSITPVYPVFW